MARITVEDCVERVPNRFELILIAANRGRALSSGATSVVEREDDKNSVLALREIASGRIDIDAVREDIVNGFSQVVPTEPQDEIGDLMLQADPATFGLLEAGEGDEEPEAVGASPGDEGVEGVEDAIERELSGKRHPD